jgi:CRISPR-associated endonuclease Cas1
MQSDHSTRPSAVPIRNGIVMLSGFGIKVATERNHLVVSDGVGRQRREGRFAKATSGIKRLVVMAQTGFTSYSAVHWLRDAKAAYIQLDYDGSILAASIGGLDDARLRRAQSMIANTQHRLAIVRELLEAKIRGQLAVLDSFGFGGVDAVSNALALLQRTDHLDVAVIAEAQAAEAYWRSWADAPMQFARRDKVPNYWQTFGMRRSPLTLRPRSAVNPYGCLLNLLYRFAEIECRVALTARGLDGGIGLAHQDAPNRQSLVLDVLEVVRPHVDAHVLNLARTRTFSAKDFIETREGAVRCATSLAHELAATMPTWANLVAPYAEMVARYVARLAKNGLGMAAPIGPRPLRDRSRIAVRVKPIAVPVAPKAARSVPIAMARNACRSCGAKLAIRKRLFCDQCLPDRRREVQSSTAASFQAAGPAKIVAMRAAGHDPNTTREVQRRRATTASQQRKAAVAWRDDGSLNGVDFERDILPKLQALPVRVIAEAMGASISHSSKVRGGLVVPHKRHWKALAAL